MDNELFELCKEVYLRNHWWYPMTESHEYYTNFSPRDKHDRTWRVKRYFGPKDKTGEQMFPIYTTDYILSKLPYEIDRNLLTMSATEYSWDFRYGMASIARRTGLGGRSDTPLKALLKLVLALDDAGIKL